MEAFEYFEVGLLEGLVEKEGVLVMDLEEVHHVGFAQGGGVLDLAEYAQDGFVDLYELLGLLYGLSIILAHQFLYTNILN